MFASRVLPKLTKAIAVRQSSGFSGSAVAGPPTIRVAFVEKIGLAGVMISCFMAYPMWVLVHLEQYKGH